jgi:hypothetical protein
LVESGGHLTANNILVKGAIISSGQGRGERGKEGGKEGRREGGKEGRREGRKFLTIVATLGSIVAPNAAMNITNSIFEGILVGKTVPGNVYTLLFSEYPIHLTNVTVNNFQGCTLFFSRERFFLLFQSPLFYKFPYFDFFSNYCSHVSFSKWCLFDQF